MRRPRTIKIPVLYALFTSSYLITLCVILMSILMSFVRHHYFLPPTLSTKFTLPPAALFSNILWFFYRGSCIPCDSIISHNIHYSLYTACVFLYACPFALLSNVPIFTVAGKGLVVGEPQGTCGNTCSPYAFLSFPHIYSFQLSI